MFSDLISAVGNKKNNNNRHNKIYFHWILHTGGVSHQWTLQIEGLSVLEEQHDVSFQVTQTAVAMTSNPLLQWRYRTRIMQERITCRLCAVGYHLDVCFAALVKKWFPEGSSYLYLPEIHRLADKFIVLWQLFSRWQLDEHLAQLTSTGTAGDDIIMIRQHTFITPEWRTFPLTCSFYL